MPPCGMRHTFQAFIVPSVRRTVNRTPRLGAPPPPSTAATGNDTSITPKWG